MIVFISDLHMSDGSAGPENVPAGAFSGTFKDLGNMAQDAKATDVTIVFLGDVFDLIRTALWQGFLMKDRPWGDQSLPENFGKVLPDSEEAAFRILEKILEKNREAFDVMGGDLTKFGLPKDTKRMYIPGNHDRLCNMYPRLRERACKELNLDHDPAKLFPRYFPDPRFFPGREHAVFARHGQEWDAFNFENQGVFGHPGWVEPNEDDYSVTPIGDVLAAEVASLLPNEVLKRVPDTIPQEVRYALRRRLMDLFDVRPMAGMIPFLAYQIRNFDDPRITKAINDGIQEVIRRFENIDFAKRWLHKHDHLGFDGADRIELLLSALKAFPVSSFESIMGLFDKLSALFGSDNFRGKAYEEFERLDGPGSPFQRQVLYVLYGHTHHPDQQAISVLDLAPDECGRVYLNTGMWRPTHHMGVKKEFVTWKNLTYTTIYKPGEQVSRGNPTKFATFETWSGCLKED